MDSGWNPSAVWGSSGAWKLLCDTFNGTHTGHTFYINGVQPALTSIAASNPGIVTTNSNFSIGSDNGDYCLTGDIAEVIIYNKALTTIELTKINTYLNNKWSIY